MEEANAMSPEKNARIRSIDYTAEEATSLTSLNTPGTQYVNTGERVWKSANEVECGEEMSSQLWGSLPEELLDRVLAWLPLHSLFRARTVCKRWTSIVFNEDFIELRAELSNVGLLRQGSYYLMFPCYGENLDYGAYYPAFGRWQSLPSLSFLPKHVKTIRQGAGGLLLLLDNHRLVFHVCNPLTGKWREIPRVAHTAKEFQTASAMVVADDTKSYKIIAAGSRRTQVYNSVTNLWTVTSGYPSHLHALKFRKAVCDGVIYNVAEHGRQGYLFGLVAYNVQTNVWSEIELKLPQRALNGHVVDCGDYVAMVAHVRTDQFSSLFTLNVFKLDPITRMWSELSILPNNLFAELMEERRLRGYSCVGVDGSIYITCSAGVRVLVFDTTNYSWHWIENCPFTLNGDPDAVHSGYSFKPSLSACA